jgi:hypothetical protein
VSVAAPAFLAAGVLAALAVIALHFLARQRPRAAPFPTARFIPERTARAPSRALVPTDLLLMLLRAMAVLLIGAAFARPAWEHERHGVARVILVDRSRTVASAAEVRDSALAALGERDAMVLFDSAAHVVPAESLRAMTTTGAVGSLSAALVAAHQAAARIADRAGEVELVLVSPLAREEWDDATAAVRGKWPGEIRMVRTAGLGAGRSALGVRVARAEPRAGDSVWAADSGGVLVRWPDRFPGGVSDSAGALVMGDDVVVGPFPRRLPPSAESRAPRPALLAHWNDGSPAATEIAVGRGCIRDVAIETPVKGDLVLRESYRRVLAGLNAPCGGAVDARGLDDAQVALLRGRPRPAPSRALLATQDVVPPLSRWLLVAAALLLIAEPLVRRRAA